MITVSIVVYKVSLEELAKCLESLQSPSVDRVYVIDNAQEQRVHDFCQKWPHVEYIDSPNVGYGAAHNLALRRVMAEGQATYHLVINSDVYFDPQVLESIVSYMDIHAEVGQLHPRVTYPDGRLQYTVRLLPTPLNVMGRYFLPKKLIRKMDDRYTLAQWDHASAANVAYHQGSFLFFRLSALQEVGLFDERFFMYPEDIDITRRMHQHYQTLYWPEVSVVHAHRAQSYHSFRLFRIHAWNMVKYFNKWGWVFDVERQRVNRLLLSQLFGDQNR